jgi:pimeloyl-ACP methyl ester carboxylesterase
VKLVNNGPREPKLPSRAAFRIFCFLLDYVLTEARLEPAPVGRPSFLVADNDVCLPLDGMYEIFDRIPAAKRMVVLRHADHMHFMDNVEQLHEAVRTSPPWIPELDYLQ